MQTYRNHRDTIGSVLKPHVSYFILVFWPMSEGWFWLRTERPCMLTWQQLIKQNIWTSYSTQGDQNWDSNLTRKGCFGVIDYFMPAASLNWRTRLGLSDPFISSIYSKCNTIFFFKIKTKFPIYFSVLEAVSIFYSPWVLFTLEEKRVKALEKGHNVLETDIHIYWRGIPRGREWGFKEQEGNSQLEGF